MLQPVRDALLAALGAALVACCGGCASESAKIVEGTDLSVGFSLPGMEGEANFTVFNWLSGFKTTTAESSRVKLRYTCAETNDYFGVVTTRTAKTVDAEITPVIDESEEEEPETAEDPEEEPCPVPDAEASGDAPSPSSP